MVLYHIKSLKLKLTDSHGKNFKDDLYLDQISFKSKY